LEARAEEQDVKKYNNTHIYTKVHMKVSLVHFLVLKTKKAWDNFILTTVRPKTSEDIYIMRRRRP